jgi:hypothetical protein
LQCCHSPEVSLSSMLYVKLVENYSPVCHGPSPFHRRGGCQSNRLKWGRSCRFEAALIVTSIVSAVKTHATFHVFAYAIQQYKLCFATFCHLHTSSTSWFLCYVSLFFISRRRTRSPSSTQRTHCALASRLHMAWSLRSRQGLTK